MTNPKRLRKIALYLEYIAHVLRDDAKDMKKVNERRAATKAKTKRKR